jgi:polar amino acid transport system substrate-binding protein
VNRVAMGLAALAATSIAVTGCGSSSSGGAPNPGSTLGGGSSSTIPGCDPKSMQTVSSGKITIGVDQPVFPPWFNDNKTPIDGNGFESAVDLAIAKTLGYTPSQIAIKRVTFNQAIGPAARNFDYDLDEFSITPARMKAVDFSAPYYDVNQAIVALKGSKAAGITSLAGLSGLKLGAQIGTTSQTAISDDIKPSASPGIYNSNSLAIQALKNGQIDALVVDLPTAFYITAVQVQNGVIVGQLANTGGKPEQFGALLQKGSPLTSCVSKAIESLRSSGELAKIQNKWLAQVAKAPVLQ